jgi:hypothetical protein
MSKAGQTSPLEGAYKAGGAMEMAFLDSRLACWRLRKEHILDGPFIPKVKSLGHFTVEVNRKRNKSGDFLRQGN